ncbi:MAG: aminotransferase class IV [Aquificaceae bacterium]
MLNRTLLFGEGLFETVRWKPSEEKLKLHYERLKASAEYFGIPYPSYEEFLKDLEEASKGSNGLYVKYLLISKGKDYLTSKPQAYGKLIITKELRSTPDRVKLCLSTYFRHSSDPLCRHKSTSYLFNLLVKRHAQNRGFWDGVIVNEKGHVCETSTANLIFLKGSKLFTPAKDCGLLWGTTLEFLRRRLPIEEAYIDVGKIEGYDCVMVLNSLILCAVVEEFEGRKLNIDFSAFEEVSRILKSSL